MSLNTNKWNQIFVLGVLICVLVVQTGGAETAEATPPATDSTQIATTNPVNGSYIAIGISGVGALSPSSLLGQIDYARRLTPTQTLRLGLALSGNDVFSGPTNGPANSYSFSTSVSVDYLFFLVKGAVEPYIGAGISLGYISASAPVPTLSPETATVYVPYGVDIPVTRFLSLGLAGKFSVSAVVDTNWSLSRLSGGLGAPQFTLALWF